MFEADFTGETIQIRVQAARRHLAELGWHILPGYDGCPNCPACQRCETTRADRLCCSSHGKKLCHLCYRRTHFVELCVAGCPACQREGLPVNISRCEPAP